MSSNIVLNSITINGQAFEGGDEGIYAEFTPDNDKYSLYVGQDGVGAYVRNQASGKGAGTINSFRNSTGYRLLKNLYQSGITSQITFSVKFEDGNIENVNLIDCKIVKADKYSQGSTGEKENVVTNYRFLARDHKVI